MGYIYNDGTDVVKLLTKTMKENGALAIESLLTQIKKSLPNNLTAEVEGSAKSPNIVIRNKNKSSVMAVKISNATIKEDLYFTRTSKTQLSFYNLVIKILENLEVPLKELRTINVFLRSSTTIELLTTIQGVNVKDSFNVDLFKTLAPKIKDDETHKWLDPDFRLSVALADTDKTMLTVGDASKLIMSLSTEMLNGNLLDKEQSLKLLECVRVFK